MQEFRGWANAMLDKEHAQCKRRHFPFKCPESEAEILTKKLRASLKRHYEIPPFPEVAVIKSISNDFIVIERAGV